ncbi:hypothetical protein [Photobacterium sp. J15]|uniref:hypothetical protein n=1 Tax=Photobacterium sp. J15 TaxID=265901 RepID=UPI0007E4B0C2|nr:hypothetical protein [Photobacterium sp. J15]
MQEELINFIGTAIVINWLPILSAFFVFCSGLITLTWLVFTRIHKQETRLLELQLRQKNEQFTQYVSIVEQRIETLKDQAEKLDSNLSSDLVINPASLNDESSMKERNLDIKFSRRESTKDLTISNFISQTDYLSKLLISLMG